MWTRFMDMHSGGGQKLDWSTIYIEANEGEAEVIFSNRFGRNPNNITCYCCGEDYSMSSEDTFEEVSGYDRGCEYAYFNAEGEEIPGPRYPLPEGVTCRYVERQSPGRSYSPYRTVEQYRTDPDVKVIPASEILPEERLGEIECEYNWYGDDE